MNSHIRNWSEYNAGLKQRGSLTVWLNEDAIHHWCAPKQAPRRGSNRIYSDLAITTFETLKSVYDLAGRQTEGLLRSLVELMQVSLSVPEHSTVSRRKRTLSVPLPVKPNSSSIHLVVDSTGVKVYGEGEWKTRQHGTSKRRTWRKLHVAVNESTGEILSTEVTLNNVHDSEVLGDLLDDTDASVEQVSADGAYDTRHCYEVLQQKGAKAVIPPRKNAKIWNHRNCRGPAHPRDENLRFIRKHGRKAWKRQHSYHRRSIAETTMGRFKSIFGGTVKSRNFHNQVAELRVKCAVLNRMIDIAKPVTVWGTT
ncbi:MAG: IS5 family transposase [Cyanophyceae cyanobacterium]